MDVKDIDAFAYIKRPLDKVFDGESSVPDDYLMDWLKDTYDYQRLHSEEELKEFLALTPEQVLDWLEEAAEFVWQAKKHPQITQINAD